MTEFRRIDPQTGRAIEKVQQKLGGLRKRQPCVAPVSHLHFDWFPVRITSGKEFLAQLFFEDQGLTTFLPVEGKYRHNNRIDRARRQKRMVEYPWHPGLIFIGMQKPYPWHLLPRVVFFQHVISLAQSEPRRMSQEHIWNLMRQFGRGRFIPPAEQRFMRSGAEFSAGDTVRVVEGVLEGQRLKVHAITGNMARVFTQWFGETRGFDIPLGTLEKDG